MATTHGSLWAIESVPPTTLLKSSLIRALSALADVGAGLPQGSLAAPRPTTEARISTLRHSIVV